MRTRLVLALQVSLAISLLAPFLPASSILAAEQDVVAAGPNRLTTHLSGREEVSTTTGRGGAGDPNGSGFARIIAHPGGGVVCFELQVFDISLPASAAHIHRGRRGKNGPIVVTLAPPDASGRSQGCVRDVGRKLTKEIAAHGRRFYVNVHTFDFPSGALRGQLKKR